MQSRKEQGIRPSRFEIYLRTGRRLPDGDIELKFNPWHDPRDGRFTSVGAGQYFGGSGGSGTTGLRHRGAGSALRSTARATSLSDPVFGVSAGGGAGLRLPATNPPKPFTGGGGTYGGGGASGSYSLPGEVKPARSGAADRRSSGSSASDAHGHVAVAATRAAQARALAAEARERARAHPKPTARPKPATSPSPRSVHRQGAGSVVAGASAIVAHPVAAAAGTAAVAGAAAASSGSAAKPTTSEWRQVSRNGYTYSLDSAGRTREIGGNLTLNRTQGRSRSAQRNAGAPDRLPADEGGHYIARRFNGPTDDFNHFAQNARFNRSDYAALENRWASELRAGRSVWVRIRPSYSGASNRPSSITVTYRIQGGAHQQQVFANASYRRP